MEYLRNRPFLFTVFVFCIFSIPCQCLHANEAVHIFKRDISKTERSSHDNSFLNIVRKKRSTDTDNNIQTESEKKDPRCQLQQISFKDVTDKLKEGKRLEETHVFENETKFNLALAWAGKNDQGILLVLTTDFKFPNTFESTLWRSTNHGRTWTNWTDKVDNQVFRKDDGLQRNPHNPSKVYLISHEHFIYVTENGGETWKKSELPVSELTVEEQLEFHSEPEFEDYVAVITRTRMLYVTYTNFKTPAKYIKADAHAVKWGTKENAREKSLYVTTGELIHPLFSMEPEYFKLERYNSETGEWKEILKRVVVFEIQDKFMYASIFKSEHPSNQEDEKLMMISSDGGDTWNEAQLPTLTGDRFFSVLDMSEGLIFMHVDNPGDTGHGVLYTSSSDGIVYSESLRNHLFPNYNSIHDFYKVESIRGVYLASQMSEADKSIHTVITYNRGGEWTNVTRPEGVECKNAEQDGCYLQIHNAYSVHRGIIGRPPNSQKEAYGIVLVHGHVASNLQTTPPDVFLSTNGGYQFKRVLQGPHAYEIADSGGLLIAVPIIDDTPNIVKFSTDEGNCWHVYKFTDESIKFTGLLTEPGGQSMTVGIWGYTSTTKKWVVNIIDFSNVVTEECKEDDYVDWIPHARLKSTPGQEGCLLGQKETFKKIKADSWCHNGYGRSREKLQQKCPCTEEDYECDFGFHRLAGSTKCVRQSEIKSEDIDICTKGHVDKLITVGYRLIPGDQCDVTNGFHPVSDIVHLDEICNTWDKSAVKKDFEAPKKVSNFKLNYSKCCQHFLGNDSMKLVVIAVITSILVLVAFVGAIFMYKMVLLRRHKVVYRYSMLNQADERDSEFENALISHDTLYRDSSEDEVEEENRSPQHNGKGPVRDSHAPKSYHDDSDDDMLG
ncbi:unnamed protein product [Lymnaea stagnalis]|uniref:VPS10 domain-containing protein n=1 Tax=Lymnaea stagnalis TaxID=6523 RepID=A0AAV2HY08_LYMST